MKSAQPYLLAHPLLVADEPRRHHQTQGDDEPRQTGLILQPVGPRTGTAHGGERWLVGVITRSVAVKVAFETQRLETRFSLDGFKG